MAEAETLRPEDGAMLGAAKEAAVGGPSDPNGAKELCQSGESVIE
jgi:hypothetical protein